MLHFSAPACGVCSSGRVFRLIPKPMRPGLRCRHAASGVSRIWLPGRRLHTRVNYYRGERRPAGGGASNTAIIILHTISTSSQQRHTSMDARGPMVVCLHARDDEGKAAGGDDVAAAVGWRVMHRARRTACMTVTRRQGSSDDFWTTPRASGTMRLPLSSCMPPTCILQDLCHVPTRRRPPAPATHGSVMARTGGPIGREFESSTL